MTKLLFISNGHGEDTIGAEILEHLRRRAPNFKIDAFPIVGSGSAYRDIEVEILGTKKSFPSGGFFYQSAFSTLRDVVAGLLGNTVKQISELKKLRGRYDLVFAIGDVVPIVGAMITRAPFIFYGCAKSNYYRYSYTPWEKYMLKKYAVLTLPRDEKTTLDLKKKGINTFYVGNPMMDCLKFTGDDFALPKNSVVVGFLPGSRMDIKVNFEDFLPITKAIIVQNPTDRPVEFLASLAPNLKLDELNKIRQLKKGKWKLDGLNLVSVPEGITVRVIQGKFGDLLQRSDIIIGLSGTGNEQATGLGKPVIAFAGRGAQHNRTFMQMKKELLGDSVSNVRRQPKIVAREVWQILSDPERIQKMQAAGRERMGGPGAAERIVDVILRTLGARHA